MSRLPVEPKGDCELGDIANISVNSVLIGKEGKEIVPSNISDLAALGSDDDRYSELIKFFSQKESGVKHLRTYVHTKLKRMTLA